MTSKDSTSALASATAFPARKQTPVASGLVVPMVTPLHTDETVDTAAIGRLVEFLLERGSEGIFTLGTTGEVSRLSTAERSAAIAATVEAVAGRVPVYAGVAAQSTRQAVIHRREAEMLGVDYTVATLPYYFPIEDAGEQEDFFLRLLEGASCPVLLYNIPWTVVAPIKLSVVVKLADHPKLAGIKDSSGDVSCLQNLAALRSAFPHLRVLCGHDALLREACALRLDGIVSSTANVLPRSVAKFWQAGQNAEVELCAELHGRFDLVNDFNGGMPYSSTTGLVLRKILLARLGLIQPFTTHPHARLAPEVHGDITVLASKIAAWEDVMPLEPATA
jgi:4-hydroxy-tetrahydrodipicolinate synthase